LELAINENCDQVNIDQSVIVFWALRELDERAINLVYSIFQEDDTK